MKLINAKPSPFGRKVAITLHEKRIAFETVWDRPWGADTCVAEYNPLAQLPILIADDGQIAFESTFILEWIERKFPDPPLLPRDDNRILEAKQLMVVAEGVMAAGGHVSFELGRKEPSDAWLSRQRQKIVNGIAWLAERIGAKPFAVGTFSQADIAVATMLTSFEFIQATYGFKIEETPWRKRAPQLAAYVDRLEQRPSFVATRPEPMQGVAVGEIVK